MDRSEVLQLLAGHKADIREKFHISRLGLFGSYATGKQTEDSDLDILYELEEGSDLGLKEIDDLEHYLKQLLAVNQIDLVDKRYINPVIELEIEDDLIYV